MTPEERALLLSVARILRANISTVSIHYEEEDRVALEEALAPFDPDKSAPVNEDDGA